MLRVWRREHLASSRLESVLSEAPNTRRERAANAFVRRSQTQVSSGLYAHAKAGRAVSEWQALEQHLANVADRAAEFAQRFGAEEWGRLGGRLHDLGKASEAFQEYLRTVVDPDPHVAESAGRVDHSTAGAQWAVEQFGVLGHLVAYAVAGHHSGLLNGIGQGASQDSRLRKEVESFPPSIAPRPEAGLSVPQWLGRDAFSIAFFTRMVYSCLVDADFLDTEAFIDAEQAGARSVWPPDVLDHMGQALGQRAACFGLPEDTVDRARVRVRRDCLRAATMRTGFFSLTVPTGGGKTLGSLAFALKHAIHHGLERVVYVAPFTSIIEQNADVFRSVMAPLRSKLGDVVIEHHSNLDPRNETRRNRLSAENWDAPLIVTTSVQFYESLFASRSSRCRKLHRLANAVIVLDEAQTLPVEFLTPCLKALTELTRHYGSTVLLCTATQPAVTARGDFPIGLTDVHEIIDDPPQLYARLKRVHVRALGKTSDAALAMRLREEEQALCIVNTRGHARELYEAVGEGEAAVHLSAAMCPAHRSAVLTQIRERLMSRQPCRVVSTQLIEAGVDISFPAVYRSVAGVDAIAQAAGRCNRNGESTEGGVTWVFESEHHQSERFLADTANCAAQIMELYPDLLDLDAVEHYFRLYYWDRKDRWDAKGICDLFKLDNKPDLPFLFSYAEAARRFRLIDSAQCPVIIPWNEDARQLCERLRYSADLGRGLLRQLQRYTVQISRRQWQENVGRTIEHVHDQFPVLMSPEMHYSSRVGLDLEGGDGLLLEI